MIKVILTQLINFVIAPLILMIKFSHAVILATILKTIQLVRIFLMMNLRLCTLTVNLKLPPKSMRDKLMSRIYLSLVKLLRVPLSGSLSIMI